MIFVKALVHHFLEEFQREASARVVLLVVLFQLVILVSLRNATETEIVDNAFKVASVNQIVAVSKVFKRVSQI